jgi:hypothetical protein
MDQYGVFELPAPICAAANARHDRCADLSDSFICQIRPDNRREVTRRVGQGATACGLEEDAVAAPSAPVLPDPDAIRLQRVLEDVRFSLERGYWQAALAAARAALTHDEVTKSIRGRLPRLAA